MSQIWAQLWLCSLCVWSTYFAQKTHKLYWDKNNPVFSSGNNRMFVEENDEVTIICPSDSTHYNEIYWGKNKEVFDLCDLDFDSNYIKLFTCDPYVSKQFSFLVTRFSWVSLNPSFKPNEPIFLVSKKDICQNYNIRIAVILKPKQIIRQRVAAPKRVVQTKPTSSSPRRSHWRGCSQGHMWLMMLLAWLWPRLLGSR